MVLLTGLYLITYLMSNACVPGTAGTKVVVLGVATVPCLYKSLASAHQFALVSLSLSITSSVTGSSQPVSLI